MGGGSADLPPDELPPDQVVWRRVAPRHFPRSLAETRPQSAAFQDSSVDGSMSVVLARSGRDPTEVLLGYDGYGLVALAISELSELKQQVICDPVPEEPDHALVVGKKTKGTRRQMSTLCRWVIRPPGVIGGEPPGPVAP